MGNKPRDVTNVFSSLGVAGDFGNLYRHRFTMAKTSPAQFVRQVRQEINRISWATRRETGTATITVFVMATIAAIFFLLVDLVLSNIVQFVLGFGG